MSRKVLMIGVAGLAVAAAGAFVAFKPHKTVPAGEAGKAVTRRLTNDQYANVIAEVFGPSIELSGRLEPDSRAASLIEVGAGQVSVSSDGMAQYELMARGIAAQVVGERTREEMLPCKPKVATEADEVCADQFLTRVGGLLFRRPLTEDERKHYVAAAGESAATLKDFYAGVSLSLGAMLASPQFLFRHERVEPDPDVAGEYRLDAYSKATRLSFFLWNSIPDDTLLAAARSGELHTARGLNRQVARMLASPRLENGVRAFFADMFGFDALPTLAKDTTLYPSFDNVTVRDAEEQTLRTIADVLVRRQGDYRDIFTTRQTFLTQTLASVYNVELINDAPNGGADMWQPYEFAESTGRAGILTHLSFLALHSHPGRSSATLRGKALREVMLCQKVPAPPAAVDFKLLEDTSNPLYKTARQRLDAHRSNPVCAGCHKITDPIGLALESFDGDGSYRATENGAQIDTTGELEGVKFSDGAGLGRAIHDNPATPICVADRLVAYGLGRVPVESEGPWRERLKQGFAGAKYKFVDLMRAIAVSEEFYRAAPPAQTSTAALATPDTSGQTEIAR